MQFLVPLFLLMVIGVTGCDTSITQLLVTEDQKDSVEQLLVESKYAFDKGNYDDALSAALKAYGINPNDEETAISLGNIYLAKGGLDGLTLAKRLMENQVDASSNPDADNTSLLFDTISGIVGINETEMLNIADIDESTGVTLYFPNTATEARASASETIQNINLAISYLCPFVDDSAKTTVNSTIVDSRHDCQGTTSVRNSPSRAHLTFALAHLAEAMAFYSVLFFKSEGEEIPNIERLADSLSTQTSDPVAYANGILSLANAVTQIFPEGANATDSMLSAMFDDIEATNRSLSAIAGLPAEFTDSITNAVSNVREDLNENSTPAENSNAMKQSLTIKMTNKLFAQIESLGDAATPGICNNYRSITVSGVEPANCSAYPP